MLNKKGGAPIGQIVGILLFMVLLVFASLFFFSCRAQRDKQEYKAFEFSKDKIEATKALNFFLEMPVAEEKKVYDLVIESYLNDDYTEFDKITKEYFSDIYNNWRLIIFKKPETFYESRGESAIGHVNKVVIVEESLLVPQRAGGFEFIRVILYIYW